MWPNPQETVDLVTFTEEIHDGKLHFFVQCKFWSEYLELISCIVLVSSGTEAYNLIQLPLFVSEWPH